MTEVEVFTARYALSPYIKQIRFVFKGLIPLLRHIVTVPMNQDEAMGQVTQLSPLSCYYTDLSSLSQALSFIKWDYFHAL
jgi:hypothetical protein